MMDTLTFEILGILFFFIILVLGFEAYRAIMKFKAHKNKDCLHLGKWWKPNRTQDIGDALTDLYKHQKEGLDNRKAIQGSCGRCGKAISKAFILP